MNNVDLIISCFNEEKSIVKFYNTAIDVLDTKYQYNLIFVNDGSIDNTRNEVLKIKENNINKNFNITLVNLSKNFGHESAMLAGLDISNADYVVFLDVDLQHPLIKINEIILQLEKGKDIVVMSRIKNKDKNGIMNMCSSFFYYLLNKLANTDFVINASDFFAINKNVTNYLKNNYREHIRFLRGIIQNIGFDKVTLYYEASNREYGVSHYSLKKLYKFALETIYSYTDLPLKIGKYMGFISILCGIIVLVYTLVTRKGAPSGYATIVIFLCFMFSILFFILGIMGEYFIIMFKEIKDRPMYIIKNIE